MMTQEMIDKLQDTKFDDLVLGESEAIHFMLDEANKAERDAEESLLNQMCDDSELIDIVDGAEPINCD